MPTREPTDEPTSNPTAKPTALRPFFSKSSKATKVSKSAKAIFSKSAKSSKSVKSGKNGKSGSVKSGKNGKSGLFAKSYGHHRVSNSEENADGTVSFLKEGAEYSNIELEEGTSSGNSAPSMFTVGVGSWASIISLLMCISSFIL
jgi:hypothetical protein